jgi:hypothetical protein
LGKLGGGFMKVIRNVDVTRENIVVRMEVSEGCQEAFKIAILDDEGSVLVIIDGDKLSLINSMVDEAMGAMKC